MTAVLLALMTALGGPALREVDLRLPSDSAVAGGLAVRVVLPAAGRWGQTAPVVVVVPGGWSGSSLSRTLAPVATWGAVEVRFCFPGEGDGQAQSGGEGDLRGASAVRALADVVSFAAGRKAAADGRSLAQIAKPIVPLGQQVGLLGLDNGGNTAILALARHAEACAPVAWVATWEAPIGDGLPTLLFGDHQAGLNPAYDPRTGLWNPATLAWDPRGEFYQDEDHDGKLGPADYPVLPLKVPQIDGYHRLAYPWLVTAAAEQRKVCGATWPTTVLTSAEAAAFWNERNAANAFADAAAGHTERLAMVLGMATDHAQAAPDHPHLWAAWQGWRAAGLSWVRLNPDAAYLAKVAGAEFANLPETPANAPLTRDSLPGRLPQAERLPSALLIAAGAMELADRVHAGRREPDLGEVLP